MVFFVIYLLSPDSSCGQKTASSIEEHCINEASDHCKKRTSAVSSKSNFKNCWIANYNKCIEIKEGESPTNRIGACLTEDHVANVCYYDLSETRVCVSVTYEVLIC